MIGKQKAPIRHRYAVSHLLHSVYSTTSSRTFKLASSELQVPDFFLNILKNHVILTKNRTLLVPEGSFATDLIPKLPTLWYPKFLTVKEFGELVIYLAEVPYRYKALLLLSVKQPKALMLFIKLEFLPSKISTLPAIDPKFPNPYTPFDPERCFKIEHSKIY